MNNIRRDTVYRIVRPRQEATHLNPLVILGVYSVVAAVELTQNGRHSCVNVQRLVFLVLCGTEIGVFAVRPRHLLAEIAEDRTVTNLVDLTAQQRQQALAVDWILQHLLRNLVILHHGRQNINVLRYCTASSRLYTGCRNHQRDV